MTTDSTAREYSPTEEYKKRPGRDARSLPLARTLLPGP